MLGTRGARSALTLLIALGLAPAAHAAPKPFLDVREGQAASAPAPSAATVRARAGLRADGAVVDVNPRTGTPNLLAGTTAPLSAPNPGPPLDAADAFVRGHLRALGLTATDLGSLQVTDGHAIPGGGSLLTYRQYADGIPAYDSGLKVALDREGRAFLANGAPQPGLALDTTAPQLSATDAMRSLMDDVGAHHALRVVGSPSGPARSTRFDTGETASLVAFGEGTTARLAWLVSLDAAPTERYSAVVDAATGRILHRSNQVKFAANDAQVFENYPGAASGGTAHTVDLTPYLNAGATDLSGPYAHAWSDLNDNDTTYGFDHPDTGETVGRGGSGDFVYPFTDFTSGNSADGCLATAKCSWNWHTAVTTWQTNRAQNTVQAFYYVNHFHDHLAAAPISFSVAEGAFAGNDRVLVNADDGAGLLGSKHNTSAWINHTDNAYMATPPQGTGPTMAMFLFYFNDAVGDNSPFRDVNGGDGASIVYHEYTHGLSSRLVTDNSGNEALDADQAGAMGEAWSDWYAQDFLVAGGFTTDTSASGEIDMGQYTDAVKNEIRSQPVDCAVGASASVCPGTALAGSGGYTYGDFGKICSCGPEVHADGEIWGETLWDLRTLVGSSVAEAIVTQGLRLTPQQPTYLQARDAILTADQQLFPYGDHSPQIWAAFAPRGMGWNASSPSVDAPVQGFKSPPSARLGAGAATAGQPVTLDASASDDPDGNVVSYDYDFDGNGTNEVTGSASSTQSHTYATPGTYHPIVTVHDNEGRTDTASITLTVEAGGTPTPTPTPTPTATATASPTATATATVSPTATPTATTTGTTTPTPTAVATGTVTPTPTPTGTPSSHPGPKVTIARTGTKGRTKVTVTCSSACSGKVTITIKAKLAQQLGLGKKRTIATATIPLAGAGRRTITIRLGAKALKALKAHGIKAITTRVGVTVRDARGQGARPSRNVRIRR